MWNIYYSHNGNAGLSSADTLDHALDRACALIDEGAVVGGIADDGGENQVSAAEIKRYRSELRLKNPG
jgi:hypothetical protein